MWTAVERQNQTQCRIAAQIYCLFTPHKKYLSKSEIVHKMNDEFENDVAAALSKMIRRKQLDQTFKDGVIYYSICTEPPKKERRNVRKNLPSMTAKILALRKQQGDENKRRILAYIDEHGGGSSLDIARALSLNRSTTDKWLTVFTTENTLGFKKKWRGNNIVKYYFRRNNDKNN